jgi:hypothetical protein
MYHHFEPNNDSLSWIPIHMDDIIQIDSSETVVTVGGIAVTATTAWQRQQRQRRRRTLF